MLWSVIRLRFMLKGPGVRLGLWSGLLLSVMVWA